MATPTEVRYCAAYPAGTIAHLVTLAEIEGDCPCCRAYAAAHNRYTCTACGHAAGDTGTLLVAVPCPEHDPR